MDGVAASSMAKKANYMNPSPFPSYEEKSAFLFAIPNNIIKHENSKWLKGGYEKHKNIIFVFCCVGSLI